MGVINHKYFKLQKNLEISWKVFSFVNSTMLDSKILIVSGATIRVIFQNLVILIMI